MLLPLYLKSTAVSAVCTPCSYIVDGDVRLVSRKGHTYKSFRTLCDCIASGVGAEDAVLDGEIVCLDERGHPHVNTLMYRLFFEAGNKIMQTRARAECHALLGETHHPARATK